MIPVLISLHAFSTIAVVSFMVELGASDDTIVLVILALNGAQALFEALGVRKGIYAPINRR